MNMGSLQLQSIVAYLPEYVNARSATNTLFRLLRVEPKIDGLSISGSMDVIIIFMPILLVTMGMTRKTSVGQRQTNFQDSMSSQVGLLSLPLL